MLENHQQENHLPEKALEGVVDALLNTSQHKPFALVAKKAGDI